MRFILLLLILIGGLPGGVMAADDFGARFAGETPSAFADPDPESLAQSLALSPNMDDAAASLQEIMPASGDDEEENEESEAAEDHEHGEDDHEDEDNDDHDEEDDHDDDESEDDDE